MEKSSKIYIAGHLGLVGSAIRRKLEAKGYTNILGKTMNELDLTRQSDVEAFFEQEKPEYVINAAAKVGGILANNTYRAQFLYENLMIQNNIIHAAYKYKSKKLLFLGSSCIYPRLAPQPIKEKYLLTGGLEPTNEPYAIAKIAGIKMCENYYRQYGSNFISVMPTNLYGPNDNFDLEKSHVLPALIRKMHLGKCLEQGDWVSLRTDLERRPLKEMIERKNEGTIEGKYESTIERKKEGTKEGQYEGMIEGMNESTKERKGVAWQLTEEEIIKMLANYGILTNHTIAQSSNRPFVHSSIRPIAQSSNRSLVPSSNRSIVIKLWGSGSPYREFLHVDDMSDACVFILENVDAKKLYDELHETHINIGTGADLTIKQLAETIRGCVGGNTEIAWDSTKPDGTPRKLLDVTLLKSLNWAYKISLIEGINTVYKYYLE